MAGGGTASQLLPRLIAAILRRKAAQNLATFETVYSSHITGRCAAVVAACALGMVNRNNKTHEGMIGSCMRFTMSDKSKYTLKLSKWSRHPTPFAQLVKKVFLTSWWTGEQAPPATTTLGAVKKRPKKTKKELEPASGTNPFLCGII